MFFSIKKVLYMIVFSGLVSLNVSCNRQVPSAATNPDLSLGTSRLSELLGDRSHQGFPLALQPRAFVFPADHGPHPAYRNEWWYMTGNLDGATGERFGYELTFFRFALTPDNASPQVSAWRTNQVYIAHFAITDAGGGEFHVAQRYARGAAGLAGATANPFRVWLDDWSISSTNVDNNSEWKLVATDGDIALDLTLRPLKPPVLNGKDGLSQKSATPGNASFYYSMTRVSSSGSIRVGDQSHVVSGLSWLDREWGSSALSSEQRGWDWFALQLSDGSELMFYNIRRNDGSADIHSAGTWVDRSGASTELGAEQVRIQVEDTWESERGGTYPARWSLDIPTLNLTLSVNPIMNDQELVTNVRYWEGAVDVSGLLAGQVIDGRGYVELTGYAN